MQTNFRFMLVVCLLSNPMAKWSNSMFILFLYLIFGINLNVFFILHICHKLHLLKIIWKRCGCLEGIWNLNLRMDQRVLDMHIKFCFFIFQIIKSRRNARIFGQFQCVCKKMVFQKVVFLSRLYGVQKHTKYIIFKLVQVNYIIQTEIHLDKKRCIQSKLQPIRRPILKNV